MTTPGAVDYFDIMKGIQRVLQQTPELGNASVLIEEELTFQSGSVVIIYLDSWSAPGNIQAINAGLRMKMEVRFEVWCFHLGIQRIDAMRNRNLLLGQVQTALMRDRSLNETVSASWQEGGDFMQATVESGFMAAASIILIAETDAIAS